METVNYGAFSESVHRGAATERLPLNGTIEVTRRCPLTCAHCYNNLPMADRDARSRELTYAEHCRILDELAEAGCLWLLFTGGEIFARRDFLDIYKHAKTKGFSDHALHQRHAHHTEACRLSGPLAAVLDRDHAVWAYQGDLRALDRHSRLV